MFGVRLRALFVLAALPGCGSELSNSEWVSQPESSAPLATESVNVDHDTTAAAERATTDATQTVSDAAPSSGPHRLDHTVTLGGDAVTDRPPGSAAPAAPGSPVVIVNVNNYASPAYGGYGYGYVGRGAYVSHHGGGSSAPSHSGAGPVQPGQDWPSAPSYGPAFPYSLSPASPWQTKR